MAALTVQQVENDIAQIGVIALNANKAAVVAAINAGEAWVLTTLTNLIKALPVPKGILGNVEGDIEKAVGSEIETYVAGLAKTYGGEAVFDLLVALLTKV
jgi:hypothetical protein